jgi:hypothetical protein
MISDKVKAARLESKYARRFQRSQQKNNKEIALMKKSVLAVALMADVQRYRRRAARRSISSRRSSSGRGV